jgi:hypothetical protein
MDGISKFDQLQNHLAIAFQLSEELEVEQFANQSPAETVVTTFSDPWRIADDVPIVRLRQIFANAVLNHMHRANLSEITYQGTGKQSGYTRTIFTAVSGVVVSASKISDVPFLRRLAYIQHPSQLTDKDLNTITSQPLTKDGWRAFVKLLKMFDGLK